MAKKKKKELIPFSVGFARDIISDHYEEKKTKDQPFFKVVKDKDLDDGESCVVFERLFDGKLFKGFYTIRYDGEVRNVGDYAKEVKLTKKIIYVYE